uniref:DDE Tnp4 domain-containing protein n=1 Tax=Fagus sylvatica TaxID=28930 RepID=A0A2N9H1F0_FAGSY
MSRSLFLRIKSMLEATEPYFVQRRNAAERLGLSAFQKMTVAIRMLAYGTSADLCDEYVNIGETTATKSLKKFIKAVVSNFSKEYLRSPTNNDIARLLALGENCGFPGMLGSIDCMHWKWKNCPTAWQSNFTGHIHEPTIILEAVASYDLWIWHAFFGLPESHNDINVLERSSVFTELVEGRAPLVNYSINDERHIDEVECGDYEKFNATTLDPVSRAPTLEFMDFIQCHRQIRDRETHSQLQSDLVEYLWQLHSNS